MKVYNALIGFWVAGALLLPLRAWAGDTTLKLSLADAVSMARQYNSSIKASRSRIEQAEARVVQSRQSLLPKVMVSETLMVTNDPGAALVFKLQQSSIESSDFMPEKLNSPKVINDFNTSVQVMQPVYNADAAIGRTIALSAKRVEEHMAERGEESIGFQVSRVYYGLVLARKNIEAVEQSIKTMQGHSSEAAKAFGVGLMTKSDKLSTEVRLAELVEQKLLLHDAVKDASDALRVLLHVDSGVMIVPTGDLVVDGVVPGGQSGWVPDERADLKALESGRVIAGYQADMARASRLPRVNAFLQTNLHSDNIFGGGSSWALGMQVQWNIFDGMASAGRMQEAKAQEREAMFNYEAARSNSVAEVERSMRSMRTAKARIAVAEKSIEESRVSLAYIGSQYRTGMAMTFELLMREQAHTYAKLRLNQAKYDYCVAKSELAFFRGVH